MKKSFKKLTATLMAVASLAVGVTGIGASAASGSLSLQNYSSRYIGGGAPGSASYTDVCELYATNAGYKVKCSTLSISGTSGQVSVKCSNYSSGSVTFTQSDKSADLSISGTLSGNAKFPCSCYGNGDVYATGSVATKG